MAVADLYVTLELKPNASADEIKRGYRRLAKKYHPDANPGDKSAEERFKGLTQAYEILSDPEKRRRYDAMRQSPQGGRGRGAGRTQGSGPQDFGDGSIEDLFSMFFGQGGSPFGDEGDQGLGGIFRRQGGRGRKGRDVEVQLDVDLEDIAQGSALTFQAPGQERALRLTLPKGSEDGARLRLAGKGENGGDLYVTLRQRPHPRFKRHGLDIESHESVPLTLVVLGGAIDVQTLQGRLKVTVPVGLQSGTSLRLTGQGLSDGQRKGDHHVIMDLHVPTDLNDEEREFFRRMAARREQEKSPKTEL